MRKILCIAPYQYVPYFSGGQKYIAEFTRNLSKKADLTVISTPDNMPEEENYIFLPILSENRLRYIDPRLILKLQTLIKKNKYNAIIWEHPYYGWLAIILKWLTGIYTVIHTHNIEYQRFRSMGKWWWAILKEYEKWTFRKADKVYCITENDRQEMIKEFKLRPEKTCLVTPGIENTMDYSQRGLFRKKILQEHGLNEDIRILLFTGLLSYKPNEDAVLFIKNKIIPELAKRNPFPFVVIVCGKGINPKIVKNENQHIIFTGFVEDVSEYIKAADLFLNPVITGGGIKTKVIEAIGFHTTVISTDNGAAGMNRNVCGDKLIIVPDYDVSAFTEAIATNADKKTGTPRDYFNYYQWDNIIELALTALPD